MSLTYFSGERAGTVRQLTILEVPAFIRDAEALLTLEELDDLRLLLSLRPTVGVVVPGTGGLRKLRIPAERKGKGKRGGARVIYYFHDDTMPLVLIAIYGKNEKADLSPAEKKSIRAYIETYVSLYKAKG